MTNSIIAMAVITDIIDILCQNIFMGMEQLEALLYAEMCIQNEIRKLSHQNTVENTGFAAGCCYRVIVYLYDFPHPTRIVQKFGQQPTLLTLH